jgi:hypothetical protein
VTASPLASAGGSTTTASAGTTDGLGGRGWDAYTNADIICRSPNSGLGARGCHAYTNIGANKKVINTFANCFKGTSTVIAPRSHAYTNDGAIC